MANDIIVNGVHTFTPEGYVAPKSDFLKEKLEEFCDRKFGLMMHFGLYSMFDLIESWALPDEDADSWSWCTVDWTKDHDEFKKQYYDLAKCFNPLRYDPEACAQLAVDAGMKYAGITTKHHDGFCMYDSKYSDYKVTSPMCPFSTNKNAQISEKFYEQVRKKGLSTAVYFSKPDWHHEDFWEDYGIGHKTTRYPTYDTTKNPEKWARFTEFVHNQVMELSDKFDPDVLWFDGGWVQDYYHTDVKIEELAEKVRANHPQALFVNRTVTGCCEDIITPEQTVPEQPLTVPWESWITIGESFSYRYEAKNKPTRYLIHMLMKIVARGGNLALNITPRPDGGIDVKTQNQLRTMGVWLSQMGEGVYSTRIVAPYEVGNIVYTRSKDSSKTYATALWDEDAKQPGSLFIQLDDTRKPKKVVSLGINRELPFHAFDKGVSVEFPEYFTMNKYADTFRIEY